MIINKENIARISSVCKLHSVKELYLFGSAASYKMNENSDIDILVSFEPMNLFLYFNNLLLLKEALGIIFNRQVDFPEEQVVRNPYLKQSIDRNKKLIYGREDTQMAS
jgi:hypothetical protein